mgnify:CR=1 FL=1
MREIKFRAWDKEQKRLVYDFETTPYFNSRVITKYSVKDCMQYTGLKDKNGVEIYEGDIVKGVFRKGVIGKEDITLGEIRFYAPSFYICPHNESKFIMPFNDNILVEKNTDYEIIGNIYESGRKAKLILEDGAEYSVTLQANEPPITQ